MKTYIKLNTFQDDLVYKFIGDHTSNGIDWTLIMVIVDKIEKITVKGVENIRDTPTECEWQFSVEIQDNQCMIHRDVFPQYYGTDEDFLKLYDCRNTDKMKATLKAIISFIRWYLKQH